MPPPEDAASEMRFAFYYILISKSFTLYNCYCLASEHCKCDYVLRKVRSRLIGGCLVVSVSEDGSSEWSLEEMSFGRLLRRASSKASDLLTFNVGTGGSRTVLDGEIIFSKNNVCVHPAEPLPGLPEHHPGTTHP